MFSSMYIDIGAQMWVVDELECLSLAIYPDGVRCEGETITTTGLTGVGGGKEGGGSKVGQAKLTTHRIHAEESVRED